MNLFYLDYLLLFRNIRYYLGACASQVFLCFDAPFLPQTL